MCQSSTHRDLNLARGDLGKGLLRAHAINGAANRLGRAEDLTDGALELLRHRARAHRASDGDDVGHRDVAVVLDVLLLLAVARRLVKSLDNERRSAGNNADLGDTVLHNQLDREAETLPVGRGLGNVITDLLGVLRTTR